MSPLFARYTIAALLLLGGGLNLFAQNSMMGSNNSNLTGAQGGLMLMKGGILAKLGTSSRHPNTLSGSQIRPDGIVIAGTVTYQLLALDFPGAAFNQAFNINNASPPAVVGDYEFITTGSEFSGANGVQYVGPRAATIDFPGAVGTLTDGVNLSREIVGLYEDSAGVIHGFQDIKGSFTTIDFPGASNTIAAAINDAGQIVGCINCTYMAVGAYQGFLDSAGVFTAIDFPGAAQTEANDINNSDEIVGDWEDSGGSVHGFSDIGGTFASIDFPGATFTLAGGVNDAGEIAGIYTDTSGVTHGFLANGGVFTTFDVPGASDTFLVKANNRGQLAGYYQDSLGEDHGFVANPLP